MCCVYILLLNAIFKTGSFVSCLPFFSNISLFFTYACSAVSIKIVLFSISDSNIFDLY